MKKQLLLTALGALLCTLGPGAVSAQTVLKPHFTDSSQKIVIPKDASVLPEIHDGLIAVSNYPNMLFVNLQGKYIFGTDFPFTRGNDYIHSPYFSGGAMMGWRTKPGAYSPSPFIVYPDGKYRELVGELVAASSFCEGYALVRKGNMMSSTQVFIDKNGREVFPLLKSTQRGTMGDMTIYPVRDGRRLFYHAELKKYGYADAQGTIIVKPQFDKANNFSEGMAAVMIKEGSTEKWGFIDKTGKLVVAATYRLEPGRFSEGLAPVRIGESASNYEMAYIDKTGKRAMENQPWNLNEFHGGFAWVGTGCDKLFVMDRTFKEVRDLTADFYHNGNGFGVCSFNMLSAAEGPSTWGFDFPGGMQMLNQSGVTQGDIFAPDGAILFTAATTG